MHPWVPFLSFQMSLERLLGHFSCSKTCVAPFSSVSGSPGCPQSRFRSNFGWKTPKSTNILVQAARNVWNVINNKVSCKTIPRQFLGNFSSFLVRSAASLKHSETLPARSRDVRQRLPSALRWSSNAPGNFCVTLGRRRSGYGCILVARKPNFGVILGSYICGKRSN